MVRNPAQTSTPPVAGVILAGGLSRRMGGGDKGLRLLGGRPLLGHVIARAQPQVRALALNANGDPARLAGFGLPVVADSIAGFAGPLAGILAGMDWAAAHAPDCPWLASFAGDAPFLPTDLVARLLDAVAGGDAAIATVASGGQAHPVFGLWPVGLRAALRKAIVDEDVRKVDVWTARFPLATIDYAIEPYDPFFNANRPDDLSAAERILAHLSR
ncbi:MAG: molybdenum cofactor guanylyltransferase MobA [Alphaproteobacteria bacterium]